MEIPYRIVGVTRGTRSKTSVWQCQRIANIYDVYVCYDGFAELCFGC